MNRVTSPAIKAARRRVWIWQASKANVNNPIATGRVSESPADIRCIAQATDKQSLAHSTESRSAEAYAKCNGVHMGSGRPLVYPSSSRKQAEHTPTAMPMVLEATRSTGGDVRDSRCSAPVDRHMGGAYPHPHPSA